MTFFFLVVGLELRREFDMGKLQKRRRLALPLVAGIGGMLIPIAIYLAANADTHAARGWGVVMATDTAFALGMLALLGSRFPARVRAFLLMVVVDDVAALLAIATVYTERLVLPALLVAVGIFGVVIILSARGVYYGPIYLLLGVAAWGSLLRAGVGPVVVGLIMWLLTFAYPAARGDLERATSFFRNFREQPTAAFARVARVGVASAISPNERLQQLFHPWTSYVVVPLFALSNAGLTIDGGPHAHAYTSPITLGILIGYVVGKPAGILGFSWLLTRISRGRLQPPVGWAAVAGVGVAAGIGFTVSLMVATIAFQGAELDDAKVGILTAGLCAAGLTWIVGHATTLLPPRLRIRSLVGTADVIVDLAAAVDPGRDHMRGPQNALVTVVEYGDFECPYCAGRNRSSASC